MVVWVRTALVLASLVAVLVPGVLEASQAAPPKRVISMNPSLSAMLLALGAREQLVGVDSWSHDANPELAALPDVGGLANPSLEAVASLRPDLVVLVASFEQRDFRAQLREVGIPVLEFDPKSFDEVLVVLQQLGDAVGRSDAARERVAAIRAARSAVESAVAGRPRPSVALVLQREPLFVVGPGSFIAEMLAAAGGENLGASLEGPYPRAGLEWLVAQRPDVLLDSSNDPVAAAEYWQRLPSLPAVKAGRVIGLGPGTATLPGPWLDRALWILACALHPTLPSPNCKSGAGLGVLSFGRLG